jgi:hypothetical protein
VKPDDNRKLDFMYGGIYDDVAVCEIEEFLQTPRATMGVAISLSWQSIHSGLGAMEPGHLFTELEDIEWTIWGQWADFAEKYGGPASITIFSLLCFRVLTWAGGLCCQCVALGELYTWTTPASWRVYWRGKKGLKGRRQKMIVTVDSGWLATPLVRNWSLPERPTPPSLTLSRMSSSCEMVCRTELRPKRTRSMANWTGSLAHIGAMISANTESGAYQRCGSVDSDIVTYVNRVLLIPCPSPSPSTLCPGDVLSLRRTPRWTSSAGCCPRCTRRRRRARRLIWE